MLSNNQDFLKFLKENHGVDLTEDDLLDLQAFHFHLSTQREARLAEHPLLFIPDPEAKGGLGGIIGGVLGLAASFVIPGLGLVTGVLIGASLGFKLQGMFASKDKPQEQQQEKQARQVYGINATTGLVPLGGTVPVPFCNREINRNGGIRSSGYLINSRVDTDRGTQYLNELFLIGVGAIGEIDESELLIDSQSRANFLADEITTYIRLGALNQPSIAQFPYYSQAISLNSNTSLGVDRRARVKRSVSRTTTVNADIGRITSGYVTEGRVTHVTKNGNAAMVALTTDAQALRRPGNTSENGYVEAQVQTAAQTSFIGLNNNDLISAPATWRHQIRCNNDGNFFVFESGVERYASATAYAANDVFAIEYFGNNVIYRRNGNTFYVSALAPVNNARLTVSIANNANSDGTRILNLKVVKNAFVASGSVNLSTTTITVSNDYYDNFSPSDNYRARGINFKILSKVEDEEDETVTLTADKAIALREDDEIFAYWQASFETTKPVEEIQVNLLAKLWARDGNNKLVKHGMVFDVYLGQSPRNPTVFIDRFYISAKSENDQRVWFKLKNLPKARYRMQLRPLERVPDDGVSIKKLGSDGTIQNFPTASVGGQEVRMEADISDMDTDRDSVNDKLNFGSYDPDIDDPEDDDFEDNQKEKVRVCTESGPPCKVTTINEVVYGANAYPGFALAGIKYLGSERIQGAPTPSFLLSQGNVDRNHLAAGTASAIGTTKLNDLLATFEADGIRVGDYVRNLDKRKQDEVRSIVSETQITTNLDLDWEKGDRYLIYRLQSSCYFPDVYACTLSNQSWGAGRLVDADEFIDYPSIVRSRKYCELRRLYWDGVLSGPTEFAQWATQEAVGSLLIPSKIDGRFAIIPEQYTTPTFIFNASNTSDYKEEYSDTAESRINTLIVSYTDGTDDFKTKTVVIQTSRVANGQEPRYEQSIAFPSVTNKGQAILAGAVVIKSRSIQGKNPVVSFKTNVQGAYVAPGDLVIVQHLDTEYELEKSGFVVSADAALDANNRQRVQLSVPMLEDVPFGNYRAAVMYRDQEAIVTNRPATVDVDNPRQVQISQLTKPLTVGDKVVLGYEIETEKIYRVSQIDPSGLNEYQFNCVYWTREMLTLNGLYVDGVCYGGTPTNAFDGDEIRNYLIGANSWMTTYTRDTAPFVMGTNQLLANAFHDVVGRGGYFPPESGTSEGQATMIRACANAFLATGITGYRDRALAMAAVLEATIYGGNTIPTDETDDKWVPHWLFLSKGGIISKGLQNGKPINYGHFDVAVTFTSGTGIIPAGQSGALLADLYNVRTVGSYLLWQNVFAPVFGGSTYEINYWVSTIKGQNYRVFPSSASSSGATPVLTGEAAGTIRLTTNFTGTAIATYSSFTGAALPKGANLEAYPMYRGLLPGEINCATDVLPWIEEAYDRLYQITRDNKWLRARNATRRATVTASEIQNLSHYYKKSDSPSPYSYPGSQIVAINNSAGATSSRATVAPFTNWLRVDVADGGEAFPSIEIQNFAVQTRFDGDTTVAVEAALSNAGLLELTLSTTPDAFDLTKTYRAYWLVPGGSVPTAKTFLGRDFVLWNTTDRILWHPTIADNPVYSYSGSGGTVSVIREQISLDGFSPVVYRFELSKGDGFAGVGFNMTDDVGLPARSTIPPAIYLKHTGAIAILRVGDANGVKWDTTIYSADGWRSFQPGWDEFRFSLDNPGNVVNPGEPATGNITSVEIQPTGDSSTSVYYLANQQLNDVGRLPIPSTTYKAAIVSRDTGAHTLYLGDFRPVGNPLDELPYTPGVLPFTINLIDGEVDAWRGVPYAGYQTPDAWAKFGYRLQLKNSLRFLNDAQIAYRAQSGNSILGPFAPVFSWSYWDAGDFLANGINQFGWAGSDPSTDWLGYQFRPLEATCKAWFFDKSNNLAETISMRFLTYLKAEYDRRGSGQPPTNFEAVRNPQYNYQEPHGAALIMRAAIYANLAGGEPDITFRVIEYSHEYLKSQYVSTGTMAGSWAAGQPTFTVGGVSHNQMFGFWMGEIIDAYALLYEYRDALTYPC